MNQTNPIHSRKGFFASRKTGPNGSLVAIYRANAAGIDDSYGFYAIVCHAHGERSNSTTPGRARSKMQNPKSFCHLCS